LQVYAQLAPQGNLECHGVYSCCSIDAEDTDFFNAMTASITTIDGIVDTINANVVTVDTVVDSIQSDVNTVSNDVGTVDTVVDSIKVTVETIDTNINTIDGIVDDIKYQVADESANTLKYYAKNAYDEFQTGGTTVKEYVNDMYTKVGFINGEVTDNTGTIKEYVNNINTQVTSTSGNSIKEYVNVIHGEVTTTGNTDDSIKEYVNVIHGEVTEVGDPDVSIKKFVDDIHGEVAVANANSVNSRIGLINTQITGTGATTINKRIEGMNTEITSGDADTIKAYVDEIYTDVTVNIEPKVASVKTDVETIKTDVAAIKTDVVTSGMKTKVETTHTHLTVSDSGNIKEYVDDMWGEILSSDTAKIKGRIAGMYPEITSTSSNTIRADITAIKPNVASILDDVVAIKAVVVPSSSPTLETKIGDIYTQAITTGSSDDSIKQYVNVIRDEVKLEGSSDVTIKKYINDIHAEVAVTDANTVNARIASIDGEVTGAGTKITAMHTELTTDSGSTVKEYINDMYTEIMGGTSGDTINEEITTIKDNVGSIKTDVEAIKSEVVTGSGTTVKQYVNDIHERGLTSVTEVSPVWNSVSAGTIEIVTGMNSKLVKVDAGDNGMAASTTGYSSGVQSWRVVLSGKSFQNSFGETVRGIRTIKVGVTSDGVSAGTIVAWHTVSGSSTSVTNGPVLKGTTTNSFCFSECIVEIILDLSSSTNVIKFSLILSDTAPFEGRPFLIQELPASQTWYPWVYLGSESGDPVTYAMFL